MEVDAARLPDLVSLGDIVGVRFPTSPAKHPHPGIVMQIIEPGPARATVLAKRNVADEPEKALCLMLMISHSPPPKGETAQYLDRTHRQGTRLDPVGDLYVCFRHFDLAFLPGAQERIVSVDGPYLGRLEEKFRLLYWKQFMELQAYERQKSFRRPQGVILG